MHVAMYICIQWEDYDTCNREIMLTDFVYTCSSQSTLPRSNNTVSLVLLFGDSKMLCEWTFFTKDHARATKIIFTCHAYAHSRTHTQIDMVDVPTLASWQSPTTIV